MFTTSRVHHEAHAAPTKPPFPEATVQATGGNRPRLERRKEGPAGAVGHMKHGFPSKQGMRRMMMMTTILNNNASEGVQHFLGNNTLNSSPSCNHHHHRPCVAAYEGKPQAPAPKTRPTPTTRPTITPGLRHRVGRVVAFIKKQNCHGNLTAILGSNPKEKRNASLEIEMIYNKPKQTRLETNTIHF